MRMINKVDADDRVFSIFIDICCDCFMISDNISDSIMYDYSYTSYWNNEVVTTIINRYRNLSYIYIRSYDPSPDNEMYDHIINIVNHLPIIKFELYF